MPWWGWAIIGIAIIVAIIWLKNQVRRGRYIRYDKDLSRALDTIGETLQRRKVLIDKWNSVQHLSDDALIQQNPPVTKEVFMQTALIDQNSHLVLVGDARQRFMTYPAPESFDPVQSAMLSIFTAAIHELRTPSMIRKTKQQHTRTHKGQLPAITRHTAQHWQRYNDSDP